MNTEKIRKCLFKILSLLATKNYSTLADNDYLKLIGAEDLERSISDYGGSVTVPKDLNDLNNYDFYFFEDKEIMLSIEYYLWIDEMKSDLTLVFYFIDANGESFGYSIYGIYIQ